MATTIAAVAAKARRDVISHFLSRNAVTPDSAVPYEPERRLRERQFERLKDRGVIRSGRSGGWYVDAPAWDEEQRGRRKRVLGGVAIGAAIAAAAALLG